MDDKKIQNRPDNVRGLVQDLSEKFDAMVNEMRESTAFAGTRPADAKTFMLISRHPRGLTELAKALGVTRQAAHKSVQRLVDVGLVSFVLAEGSKRDMIADVTEKGLDARAIGLAMARQVDTFVETRVGKDGLEQLRTLLAALVDDP